MMGTSLRKDLPRIDPIPRPRWIGLTTKPPLQIYVNVKEERMAIIPVSFGGKGISSGQGKSAQQSGCFFLYSGTSVTLSLT